MVIFSACLCISRSRGRLIGLREVCASAFGVLPYAETEGETEGVTDTAVAGELWVLSGVLLDVEVILLLGKKWDKVLAN
jgi:hypothetical protein